MKRGTAKMGQYTANFNDIAKLPLPGAVHYKTYNIYKQMDGGGKLAAASLEMAANFKYPPALFDLGTAYLNGDKKLHIKKDPESAKYYLDLAAKTKLKGFESVKTEAQAQLGFFYNTTNPPNYEQAAKWYQKAAEQGIPQAQFNLALLYQRGLGVKKDLKISAKWLEKAANQGISHAQNALGHYYEKGFGVEQNYVTAANWYQKALEQNHSQARTRLTSLLNTKKVFKTNISDDNITYTTQAPDNKPENTSPPVKQTPETKTDQTKLPAAKPKKEKPPVEKEKNPPPAQKTQKKQPPADRDGTDSDSNHLAPTILGTIDPAQRPATKTTPQTNNNTTNGLYTVVSGDTIWGIAKKQLQKQTGKKPSNKQILNAVDHIAAANGFDEASVNLIPPQDIKIPNDLTTDAPQKLDHTLVDNNAKLLGKIGGKAYREKMGLAQKSFNPAATAAAKAIKIKPKSQADYTVEKGDTLSKIARQWNKAHDGKITWQQIAKANGLEINAKGNDLKKGQHLGIGQELKIPTLTQ